MDSIIEIIDMAKQYMKESGINQWQDGYPNREQITMDIDTSVSYIIEDNSKIIGTAVITFFGDTNYDKIYDGKWLSDNEFCAIHRIAVNSDFKGKSIAKQFVDKAESLSQEKNIHSIKVDTHRQNLSMQKFLLKNGFTYCGIIYLDGKMDSQNERFAYEKII